MNMQDRPDNAHLRDLFLDQIKRSAAMKHSMNVWADMPHDDPNRTYDWLARRVEAFVDQQRIEGNLQSVKRALGVANEGEPAMAGSGSGSGPTPKR